MMKMRRFMTPPHPSLPRITGWIVFLLAAACGLPPLLLADGIFDPPKRQTGSIPGNERPAAVTPIGLYQRIISRADGDRCPMYPSCSHYAKEAFAKEGLLIGWILTCDRLLRCGRDETRLAAKVTQNGTVSSYDPLNANTFWWDEP